MPGKALHHVELCVSDGSSVLAYLTDRFGFKVTAERETEACHQKVVAAGECIFVVTERMKTSASSSTAPFETFCCTSTHMVDSVFNVSLEVRDVDRAMSRFVEAGARLLVAPTVAADSDGQVRYAVVRSCCGNIVHTLLDKSGYCGPFLPTFRKVIRDNLEEETERITHIDHLTFVCHPGESKKIIDWYGQCLGTKPFRASIEEDPIEGLVIGGGIGMRLRVMDYWRCAETGVYLPECERGEEASSLKIVLAETLPGQGNTHIQAFLDGHGGPGLQHIGFHTQSIDSCVRNLAGKGVPFRKAPSAYYRLPEKQREIQDAGFSVDDFRQLGILVDTEAPLAEQRDSPCYLLQIFTLPVFEQETFFFEVIERRGARGFGSGNVTALARSIEEQKKQALELANNNNDE